MKLEKLVFKFDNEETIKLSLDEAKQMYQELKKLFDVETPSYTLPRSNPLINNPPLLEGYPYKITCDSDVKGKFINSNILMKGDIL